MVLDVPEHNDEGRGVEGEESGRGIDRDKVGKYVTEEVKEIGRHNQTRM